jgi:lysophospholipid acyltransferase (LPLAT)-like uncharacterized protein
MTKTSGRYFRSNWKDRVLPGMAVFLLRLLFSTLRLRVVDQSGLTRESPPFPLIYTFWHNRILAITVAFLRHYPKGRKGVAVLTSPSRDGEILARVVGGFGMDSIRGSTNKRGAAAVRECVQWLSEKRDLAVTPDGPRGPRYQLGPGLLLMAQQTGAKIQPVHARFSGAIRLKTWDGFCLPLPFSRIDVTLGAYETILPTASASEFEAERRRVETLLQNEAD